jgi:glutathione synthase
MNPQTFASWPPTLCDQQLELLKTSAMNFAMAKGMLMLPVENQNSSLAAHAPFALFPSPFPRAGYEYSVKVQPIFNKLVHNLSRDNAFIEEVFEP